MRDADLYRVGDPRFSSRIRTLSAAAGVAALGVLLISASSYANTAGFVIGRITAQGPVTVGDGARELAISDSVEPYFGGENVTTMDGATAVVRMGGESATLQVLPASKISVNVDAAGSYAVEASGSGLEFAFSGNEQFVLNFACLRIRGGPGKGAAGAGQNSGSVATDGTRTQVTALKGEFSLTTTTGEAVTVRRGETFSGCETAIAAADSRVGERLAGAFVATTTVVAALVGQRNSSNPGLLDTSTESTDRPAKTSTQTATPGSTLNEAIGSTANTTRSERNSVATKAGIAKTKIAKTTPVTSRPGKKKPVHSGKRPVKVPPKIIETSASPVGGKARRKRAKRVPGA